MTLFLLYFRDVQLATGPLLTARGRQGARNLHKLRLVKQAVERHALVLVVVCLGLCMASVCSIQKLEVLKG